MKVYVLKYYYNEREQLDGYVDVIFKEKPTVEYLVNFYREGKPSFGLSNYHRRNLREFCERLVKGEEVFEIQETSDGRSWLIEKIEMF